jgi:hypothetical protein
MWRIRQGYESHLGFPFSFLFYFFISINLLEVAVFRPKSKRKIEIEKGRANLRSLKRANIQLRVKMRAETQFA